MLRKLSETMLFSLPNPLTQLAWAVDIIKLVKWIAVAFTIAIPSVGLILWVVQLVRKGIGASKLNEIEKNG